MPEYTVPEYTVAALLAPVAVVALELAVLRTGLLGSLRYWIAIGIVLGFQVPVDGWLTRPDAPVVSYQESAIAGVRVLGHFPVEDLGFGYAMVTLTLLLWRYSRSRVTARSAEPGGAVASDQTTKIDKAITINDQSG